MAPSSWEDVVFTSSAPPTTVITSSTPPTVSFVGTSTDVFDRTSTFERAYFLKPVSSTLIV